MTPDQLSKSGSEHGHQVGLFAWCAVACQHGFEVADAWANGEALSIATLRLMSVRKQVPALRWIHAIPNGGSRGDSKQSQIIRGGQLKAEGVRSGVADIFLPFPAHNMHGLYIEMKKPSQKPKAKGKGGLSDEQIEFADYVKANGYGWVVCYSWREAADIIKQYLT